MLREILSNALACFGRFRRSVLDGSALDSADAVLRRLSRVLASVEPTIAAAATAPAAAPAVAPSTGVRSAVFALTSFATDGAVRVPVAIEPGV